MLAALVQLQLSEDTVGLIVDVIESRLDIWAALDLLPDLSQALMARFVSIKKAEQPIPRRLLSLLVTFAGHDLLDAEAQMTLKQELQSMVVAASPTSARQSLPQLPIPLPEMQALLADSSPAATSQLASSLWHRYRGHPHWITALLDSSVLYIPQLGAAEPLIELITNLESRTPLGVFSAALAPWTSNMSVSQAETIFGGAYGEATAFLFAELGIAGVFDTPALLKDLVAPVRRTTLKSLLRATGTSCSTDTSLAILHNVQLVFAPVIAPASSPGDSVLPGAHRLPRRHRISARRAALTRCVNLPAIAEALAGLIVEQEVARRLGYDDVAEHTGAYFVRLASLPRLRALFARVPRALRDGMLDNEALNALPTVQQLRPNLLAGLLVVLKDGGAGELLLEGRSKRTTGTDFACSQLRRRVSVRPRNLTSSCRAYRSGGSMSQRSSSLHVLSASNSIRPYLLWNATPRCTPSLAISSSESAVATANRTWANKLCGATAGRLPTRRVCRLVIDQTCVDSLLSYAARKRRF